MTTPVSRRRALAVGIGALAGCLSNPRERPTPTDRGDDPTPAPATATATPTTEPGCGTPVGQEWGSRDEDPSVPPCPEKPGALDACSARAFAIGLEKHRRYAQAIERYDRISAVSFAAYTATVTETESGFLVSARLYVAVDGDPETTGTDATERTGAANGTTSGGTPEPTDPFGGSTGVYDVAYLVTADGQWRTVGSSEGFRTEEALRRAGSEVRCLDGAA